MENRWDKITVKSITNVNILKKNLKKLKKIFRCKAHYPSPFYRNLNYHGIRFQSYR